MLSTYLERACHKEGVGSSLCDLTGGTAADDNSDR